MSILDKFRAWEIIDQDPDLERGSLPLVLYLAKRVYGDYEPSGLRPFMLRLEKWLNNVGNEKDQKILISLLSHLFFAGRGEFDSLYRSTLTNIYRWLIDINTADISDPGLNSLLERKLQRTWICPITDSLRINSFLKINGISGHDHRPHWRSLAQFGEVKKIKDYMDANQIEYLVLLEDFVGSGIQVEPTIKFVCENFEYLPLVLCPLIVCPDGDRRLRALAADFVRLTYLPTMVLPKQAFLHPTPHENEPLSFTKGRALLNKVKERLPTNAFGYQATGALIVLFSNCPDNTLAIFRDEATTWEPLFPRVWRPE